jgi:hypothetical protein
MRSVVAVPARNAFSSSASFPLIFFIILFASILVNFQCLS